MGTGLVHSDLLTSHEPDSLPLTRPPGTLSPTGGEGWGEGVRFTGRLTESLQAGARCSPGGVPWSHDCRLQFLGFEAILAPVQINPAMMTLSATDSRVKGPMIHPARGPLRPQRFCLAFLKRGSKSGLYLRHRCPGGQSAAGPASCKGEDMPHPLRRSTRQE